MIPASDLALILQAAHAEPDTEPEFLEMCYRASVEECSDVLGPRDDSRTPEAWQAEVVARTVARFCNRGDGERIDPPRTASFVRQKFQ